MRSCRRVSSRCKRSRRMDCPSPVFTCVAANGKVYDMPRRFSRSECRGRPKGFTKRASCAPFRGASSAVEKRGAKNIRQRAKHRTTMTKTTNVRGNPLQPCSKPGMPATGYTRDGICSLHQGDRGSHHVCLKDVSRDAGQFCIATKQLHPNWCRDTHGDWCVCEWAFKKAVDRLGCKALNIDCDATNSLALDHYIKYGNEDMVKCIQEKCGPFKAPSTALDAPVKT